LGSSAGGTGISLETVKSGAPGPNDPAPRSDAPPAVSADPFARPAISSAADPNELKPTAPDPNELKPSGPPDPNELKVSADTQSAVSGPTVPPPVQVNEIQQGQAPSDANAAAVASSSSLATDKDISSSKKKKKTGLKKVISF
jgi:hypothetical protein